MHASGIKPAVITSPAPFCEHLPPGYGEAEVHSRKDDGYADPVHNRAANGQSGPPDG
jgi:hypothetical protein